MYSSFDSPSGAAIAAPFIVFIAWADQRDMQTVE